MLTIFKLSPLEKYNAFPFITRKYGAVRNYHIIGVYLKWRSDHDIVATNKLQLIPSAAGP